MILDSSKVSLADGQAKAAIDLFPGSEVLSYNSSKMGTTTVVGKQVSAGVDVIGLVLSNGQRLCGTRTHTVGTFSQTGRLIFREFADIKIGDKLRGERAGMTVVVKVVGLLYFPRRDVRLVGFDMAYGRAYVAEGVLCR